MAVHTDEPPRKPKAYRPVSETRKVRKPLMERKRRERINNSLEQLALLLKEAKLVAADKPVAKLEKADILELTVRHLRTVRPASQNSEVTGTAGENKIKREIESPSSHRNHSPSDNKKLVIDLKPGSQNHMEAHAKVPDDETCSAKDSLKTFRETRDSSYMEGFHKCLTEVKQATESAQELCALKERLFSHLEKCLLNLTPEATSKEKNSNGKRALHEGNNCDIKAKKKKKRSDQEVTQSSSTTVPEAHSELTLVPMQLTDGRVAFLLRGDAKVLISNKTLGAGSPKMSSEGISQQPPNEVRGLTQKLPKLLPATQLHKLPTCGIPVPPSGTSEGVVAYRPLVEGVVKNNTQKTLYSISAEKNLCAPLSSNSTSLLNLYPNIKTVNLPIGTCVTTSHTSNLSTASPSGVTPCVGGTQLARNELTQAYRVNASLTNVLCPSKPEHFATQSSTSSESYRLQTSLLQTSNNTNKIQCNVSQTPVRRCIVYPRSHLAPVEVNSSIIAGNTTTSTALLPIVATATPAPVRSHIVQVASTVLPSHITQNPHSTMHLGGSRIVLDPQRESLNTDQLAGPSIVSFPPTPPPSVDQYSIEPPGDERHHSTHPSSFSAVLPNTALDARIQSSFLMSYPTNVPQTSSHFHHSNSLSTFVDRTVSSNLSRDEEEYIDVENVYKEDQSQSLGFPVNSGTLKCNDQSGEDMWRPW